MVTSQTERDKEKIEAWAVPEEQHFISLFFISDFPCDLLLLLGTWRPLPVVCLPTWANVLLRKCLRIGMNLSVGEKLPVCAPFCVALCISSAGVVVLLPWSVFRETLRLTLRQGVPVFPTILFFLSSFLLLFLLLCPLFLFRGEIPVQFRKVFHHIGERRIR